MSQSERVCPDCGSHEFGSHQLADGTLQRLCNGYKADGQRCDYTWHQSKDAENGIHSPDGETAVGQVLSTI